MGQLLVRNLDDRIVSRLKRQAERENLSLEQKVRSILGQAVKRDPEEFDRVTRGIRAQTTGAGLDINALIREDRDR
jgi:plasmid stability protein